MTAVPSAGLWPATRGFVADVARFAGWRGVRAVALVAAGAVLEGFSIVLLVPILALVTGSAGGPWGDAVARALGAAGAATPSQRLGVLLAAFVAAMALRAAVLYARDVALAALQSDYVESLRERLMTALARAPWPRVADLRHAELVSLLGSEAARVAASTHYLIQGGVALAMLAAQAVLALALAPWLAGGVLAAMLVGGVAMLLGGRGARSLGGAMVDANHALMASATEFLGGLKIAAAQNAQPWFLAEFRAVQRRLRGHAVAFVRRLARNRLSFALVSAGAGAVVVWIGVAGGLAASVLITLILVFARMAGPALTVQQAAQSLFHGIPGFEAIGAMERRLGEAEGAAAAVTPVPSRAGAIALDGATWRHAAGGGISDVTLTIAAGEFLGVTGPSGAGKTSLVDLLAGLVAPQEGTVSVGGVALDEGARAGWRSRVAYVPQDGYLFHDSVRRNLCWDGGPDAAEIAAALALTGADRVVAGLPEGLDTLVGERGARLSGGERQRLALARALLRRPALMILDEATSALDIAAERAILTRLAALDPRPTIVLVAHRGESLALCDRVVRVVDGRLAP